MNVGLPGTGLGGLFYFFSVILMVAVEFYLTARGRSSIPRWKFVSKRVLILVLMLLTLYITLVAVKHFFYAVDKDLVTNHSNRVLATDSMIITVSLLLLLVVSVNAAGFYFRKSSERS